jgi:predicted O-methyltransferase YrrM
VEAVQRDWLRANARRFNRLRWSSKLANVRHAPPGGTAGTLDKIGYVLLGAELGDHSFDITDELGMATYLSAALSVPVPDALTAVEEVRNDVPLRADYARLKRLSLVPRRLRLSQRVLWWAIVRLRKPSLVVETGVWYGLGSAVLLRALELNAEEGHDGELISFDPDRTGGWLVPERLKARWNWVKATSDDALEATLFGRELDLFIHDTPSDHERESYEFRVALRHSAPGAVLYSANGRNTNALEELCEAEGLPYHHFAYAPDRHFYVTRGVSLTQRA